MHHKVPLTLLALAALALPHAGAVHCNGTVITIDAGIETFYIDDRSDTAGEIDHWVYQESNGIEGLQSGGGAPILLDPTFEPYDPCAHPDSDTLIL